MAEYRTVRMNFWNDPSNKSPAGDAGLRHMPWNRYNVE